MLYKVLKALHIVSVIAWIGPVALLQVAPRRAGAQHVKDPV
jgi:uncharacterized membrane protein